MVRRKTIEEVKKAFEDRGFTLVSKEYKNNKQRLEYICPNHVNEIQTTRLNDLLGGHGCLSCANEERIKRFKELAEGQKFTLDEVRKEFKVRGYKLLSKKYRGAKARLQYECPNHLGKELFIRLSDLRSGARCRYCVIDERKVPIEKVRKAFEDAGYILLERDYVNSNTPMKYKCPKHPEINRYIRYDDLRTGVKCYECALEGTSGENSAHYRHDLTDEERHHNRRLDPLEREWRIKVFQRDNFRCVVCQKERSSTVLLNAHHKDAHHWCVERRYDVANGETLCEDCHREFHRKYGYKNNTEQQYLEWIKSKESEEDE